MQSAKILCWQMACLGSSAQEAQQSKLPQGSSAKLGWIWVWELMLVFPIFAWSQACKQLLAEKSAPGCA